MAYNRSVDTATIPSAGTTSPAISVPSRRALVGVQTPATITSTALTFEASGDDGASWVPVYEKSTLYSLTIAASRYHAVDPLVFAGISLLRIVGGSTEAAARDVKLIFAD